REEELEEARGPGVEQAEAVTARLHLEERLDLAVHQELVADDAVEAEEIEGEQSAGGIVHLVGEGQRDVELGEARKVESRALVARVELVEQQVEPEQTLVDVLGREVHAMVVVPECTQRLVDVAGGLVGRVEAGQRVRIVLITEVTVAVEIAGVAVALRR